MPEPKSDLRLEIAHVLFIDIVGYSKRLIDEQHELLQDLNQIVRNTAAFRSTEASANLIRVPTGGDGMALVFSTSPEADRKIVRRKFRTAGTEWLRLGIVRRHGERADGTTGLKSLESQRYVPPSNLALLSYVLGEKDEAFSWLEKAYQDRDIRLCRLKVDSKWDSMRSEPRFVEILKRIGLQ